MMDRWLESGWSRNGMTGPWWDSMFYLTVTFSSGTAPLTPLTLSQLDPSTLLLSRDNHDGHLFRSAMTLPDYSLYHARSIPPAPVKHPSALRQGGCVWNSRGRGGGRRDYYGEKPMKIYAFSLFSLLIHRAPQLRPIISHLSISLGNLHH